LKAAGRVVMTLRVVGDATLRFGGLDARVFPKTWAPFRRRRIGVVKLLRARGGCLGVIGSKRTWKAAKSLGERPNARRSQNARTHAGN
jgi:hypothetical protein